MKRKILILIFSLICAVFISLSLAACKPPHRYSENWSYDSETHWKDVECIHDVEPIIGEHEFEDYVCPVCGYYIISEELNYRKVTLTVAGTPIECYEVSGFYGYGYPEYVGIPSAYDGKPVVGIAADAFNTNYCTGIKKIILSEYTTYISENAFSRCISLEKIDLPNGLTTVGRNAFAYCESLKSITLPSSLTSIGDRAFYRCTSLEEISVPDSVKDLGQSAFAFCENLKSAHLGTGVSVLKNYVFQACAFESIVIPENIAEIKDYAFRDCVNLTAADILNGGATVEPLAFFGCNIAEYRKITVYDSIASTPDISAERVIIDWSKEENTDVSAQNRKQNLGCVRENNIDIAETVGEVTFIGNPDKIYRNLTINICSRAASSPLTIKFTDFNFKTNDSYAIKPWNSEDFELTVINIGKSSVGTSYYGGNIFGYSAEDGRFKGDISFTGSGTLTLTAGGGSTGADGGTAIFARYINVDGVKLTASGGYGGSGATGSTGSRGDDGGNGGHAIVLTGKIDRKLAENEYLTATGGNGGRGGDGGKGSSTSTWFQNGGKGGNGGNGGNGGAGIIDSENKIAKKSGYGGSSGSGGKGGSGGTFGSSGSSGSSGQSGSSASSLYKSWE